jgi:hypothetical protein
MAIVAFQAALEAGRMEGGGRLWDKNSSALSDD